MKVNALVISSEYSNIKDRVIFYNAKYENKIFERYEGRKDVVEDIMPNLPEGLKIYREWCEDDEGGEVTFEGPTFSIDAFATKEVKNGKRILVIEAYDQDQKTLWKRFIHFETRA